MATRVIVEGPDGGGKTTFIGHLQDELSKRKISLSVQPRACTSDNGPMEELREYVDDYLSNHKSGIWDRHPLISEPIYGPIIRGHVHPSLFDRAWLSSAYAQFYAYDPIIIYCMPPWFKVMDNIQATHKGETDHLQGVITHAMAIYDMYFVKMASDMSRANVFQYDFRKPDNFSRIVDRIEERYTWTQ